MPKSRAEIQKAYRERKKAQDREAYLEKDRKRKVHIPIHLLNPKDAEKRREQVNARVKKHYMKKKEQLRNELLNSGGPGSSTRTKNKSSFIVKLSLSKRTRKHKKRTSQEVRHLMKEKLILTRENQKLKKRLQRNKLKMTPEMKLLGGSHSSAEKPSTPRSKAKHDLRRAGISPRSAPEIRKKLEFSNCMIADVKQRLRRAGLQKLLSGQALKKYKYMKALSQELNISRKRVAMMHKPRKQRKTMRVLHRDKVIEFLKREDNSTCLPGKRDTKTSEGQVNQKYSLNDYLQNLHQKFLLENPMIKISKTMFCYMRPKYIMTTDFSNRKSCLCSRHQNFALKLKSLKNQGVPCTLNPDIFVQQNNAENLDLWPEGDGPTFVEYSQWKKVQDKDVEKYRWKVIEVKVKRDEFVNLFKADLSEMKLHIERVSNQFTQMRKLRENLPTGEIVVWMDFAENFTCSQVEAIQSAYWNPESITLHTMVVYFPNDIGHRSIVAISDDLTHDASMVYAIIHKLIPKLKAIYPVLKTINYLTDSPTSQYRNRTVFQMVACHENDFGISARWNYLESGHGKGPCDGLGASVKRSASEAVGHGKVVIQSAGDFFAWSQQVCSTVVEYMFVSKKDRDQAKSLLQERSSGLKRVIGTMKIHAVTATESTSEILSRNMSCVCNTCLISPQTSACSWDRHLLLSPQEDEDQPPHDEVEILSLSMDDWVAAVYMEEWYIGHITDMNEEEIEVDFLERTGRLYTDYRRPTRPDIIWLHRSDVLCTIDNPARKRGYKLSIDVISKIEEKMEDHRAKVTGSVD